MHNQTSVTVRPNATPHTSPVLRESCDQPSKSIRKLNAAMPIHQREDDPQRSGRVSPAFTAADIEHRQHEVAEHQDQHAEQRSDHSGEPG